MKYIVSQISFFLTSSTTRRNTRLLFKFVLMLFLIVSLFSFLFHVIMLYEGREFSIITGFYWTLTVMSTLGFGDITFASDLGKTFSIFVLVSGIFFLLILLPFTFIQFFYAPFLQSRQQFRAPRELNKNVSGHIIITNYDSVTSSFINKLKEYDYKYVVLSSDVQQANELHDSEINVVYGGVDDPKTYIAVNVEKSAMVVATGNDRTNTNIAFTVREICSKVMIVTFSKNRDAVDILKLAGSDFVLQLGEMLGAALSRRVSIGKGRANPVGNFDKLIIAESPVIDTGLVGKTLRKSMIRQYTGVNVIGIWERGSFSLPNPDTMILKSTVLVLAGTKKQIASFDKHFHSLKKETTLVIIIGAGTVGLAAAKQFKEREIDYRIIERDPEKVKNVGNTIIGDASDINVLEKAGIKAADACLITTNDDDTNVYLTIYCRRLRPDIQILTRANLEKNFSTLYRAGSDMVMSYTNIGADAIFNLLNKGNIILIAEGLQVFSVLAPETLKGKCLSESDIRSQTGCSVIAIKNNSDVNLNPMPETVINKADEIILIGTSDSQKIFMEKFV